VISTPLDTRDAVETFVRDFNVDFPVLLGGRAIYGSYASPWTPVSPFPLDCVIDAQGRVAYLNNQYDPDGIVAVIDSLLGYVSVAAEDPWEPADPIDPELPPEAVDSNPLRAYPNPFGGLTQVRFEQERPGPLWVEVYAADGRRVARLARGEIHAAGEREFVWDGRDEAGAPLGSGYYFVRVRGGGRARSAKVLLLR
jgi:hypothetical protein